MNIDDAVKHLDDSAQPASTGFCAKFVRQAIEAGGVSLDEKTRPLSAKSYGPYLEAHGFSAIPQEEMKEFVPRKGDIVVLQPYEGGTPHGHIAMYNGTEWVSDFKQRDIWAGPGFRKAQPSLTIYRP